MQAIPYSSIGQYRSLVKDVRYAYQEALPVLKMTGTVKVHGTNASVAIDPYGTQYPQSRKNIISPDKDNAGFAAWHDGRQDVFDYFNEMIRLVCGVKDGDTIVIYGEWAGRGIQKGVAVSSVDKFFYIFGVKIVGVDGASRWLEDYPILKFCPDVVDARDIWRKELTIDFNAPEQHQNDLVDLTVSVEAECPVGKYFGVTGIGEGVVWEHITNEGARFACKVKGEKHSSSKVKKLASVDVEKVNSIEAFVQYAVTDKRLEQGLTEVCNNDADRKRMGQFIKWVSSDIMKEEGDTLSANGLTMKDVGRAVSTRAKNWFFAQEMLNN